MSPAHWLCAQIPQKLMGVLDAVILDFSHKEIESYVSKPLCSQENMQIIQCSFPCQEHLCSCPIRWFPWDNMEEKLGETTFHTPLQRTPKTSRISTESWFCHNALPTKIPDTPFNLRLHCSRSRHGKKKKKAIIQQVSVVQTILLGFVHMH